MDRGGHASLTLGNPRSATAKIDRGRPSAKMYMRSAHLVCCLDFYFHIFTLRGTAASGCSCHFRRASSFLRILLSAAARSFSRLICSSVSSFLGSSCSVSSFLGSSCSVSSFLSSSCLTYKNRNELSFEDITSNYRQT